MMPRSAEMPAGSLVLAFGKVVGREWSLDFCAKLHYNTCTPKPRRPGAEFDWGQLAEAYERWGDRGCRSMQRVRHRGVAGVLFVNEGLSQFNRPEPCEGLGEISKARKPFSTGECLLDNSDALNKAERECRIRP